MIPAEAYMGAEPIVEALRNGAQIVITGRVEDPSIFMAPMMYEFGWAPLDHHHLGIGNSLGPLLECGAQVTGGYFSDPGFKRSEAHTSELQSLIRIPYAVYCLKKTKKHH